MFDVAIIGTGPAGISAALTLKSLNKNVILFGATSLSAKIRKAERIRNYPGLIDCTGEQMQQAFADQLVQMDIAIEDKRVTGVYHMGDYYGILCNQDMYEAKTVILAVGVESVKPIAGELEFLGRGVSYCATCDGFLYRGKTIAVIATDAEFEHEVAYLADLAQKVYYYPIYRGCSFSHEKMEICSGMPTAITGAQKVANLETGETKLDIDGVFLLKSSISPAALVSGLQVEGGHVVADRSCKTNLPGLFAAGDCTGRPYQYVKAAGEGNVAAHSAVQYLAENK